MSKRYADDKLSQCATLPSGRELHIVPPKTKPLIINRSLTIFSVDALATNAKLVGAHGWH